MAWIESHQALERHPKTFELMNLMGWDLDTTIGKLHRFWWWCVDYAEDGDLRKHSVSRLGLSVNLNDDEAKKFVQAMLQSGWLDRKPYFRIHDWWDYIGLFLQRKYGDKKRHTWERIKKLYEKKRKIDIKDCTITVQQTVHQLSQPNQPNQPNQPTKEYILSQAGEEFKKFALSKKGIDSFMTILASQNKTGLITESRKLSLLCQLSDVLAETGDETIFNDALLEMTGKGIANINYLKQVITSKKKGGNSGHTGSRQFAPGKTRDDSTESDKYDGLGTVINLGG